MRFPLRRWRVVVIVPGLRPASVGDVPAAGLHYRDGTPARRSELQPRGSVNLAGRNWRGQLFIVGG